MTAHRTTLIGRTAGPLLVIAALAVGSGIASAQATSPKTLPEPQKTQPMGAMMADESQASAMMAERQQMMADMKAMDQKVNDLVATMNAARGTERVDAIAAVVNELVTQRQQMRERMTAMQDRMMGHMTGHMMSMQGGMMGMMSHGQAGEAPSMATCPMMKGLAKEGPGK